MGAKLNSFLLLLTIAVPAYAQLDSVQLRVQFGPPLNREIFRVPPGIDITVDYGEGNQVCKLTVPALMPTDARVQNTDDMKQKMYAFLAGLVPDSMRGKELQRLMSTTGAHSTVSVTEYERVRIVETYSGFNDTISVRFKNSDCEKPIAQ